MKRINYRRGDLELRSTGRSLFRRSSEKDTTLEIVKWSEHEEVCFTVAYWVRSKDEFDLIFVGSRPLDLEDDLEFMLLVREGQKILEGLPL